MISNSVNVVLLQLMAAMIISEGAEREKILQTYQRWKRLRSKKHNAQTGTLRLGTLQGRKVARIFEGLGFATLKARPCPMNRGGQPVLLTGII